MPPETPIDIEVALQGEDPGRCQGLEGIQGRNQAWGGVIKGAAMRLRRRRLQPKATAAPNTGSGPGAAAVEGPTIIWIVSLVPVRDQVPIKPVVVKPMPARVWPLNVALLTIWVFEV